MSDLKPCPFCGEEVRIDEFYDPFITIDCDSCISSIRLHAHTQEDGISTWNNRNDGWIKCSDRLPDVIGYYLACSKYKIYWVFFNSEKNWCNDNSYISSILTHWMPLPPIPE